MRLELDHLTCGYGRRSVVRDVSLKVGSGEALYLLGPNGSGKTTLFKTVLGLLPRMGGTISMDGEDITDWPAQKLASKIAYVPQAHTPPFAFTVLDVVLTARSAHIGLFATPGRKDEAIAKAALATMGVGHLAGARYTEISGGERQLVLIARAIAQETPLLMMDEPAANLDFGNQLHLLHKVRALTQAGYGLIITTHQPDHAFSSASKVALLHQGQLIGLGVPEDVMTAEKLHQAYGVKVRVIVNDGIRICAPVIG